MIEVEKKFLCDENSIKKIERRGKSLSYVRLFDTYYDTPDFTLAFQNVWLRKRNDRFELKISIKKERQDFDFYHEIYDEKEILKRLGFEGEKDLESALKASMFFPFISYTTDRKKYQIESFIVDIDRSFCEDFSYSLMEIEKIVEKEEEMSEAKNSIREFAISLGLEEKRILGKLGCFLSKTNEELFQALLDEKIFRTCS